MQYYRRGITLGDILSVATNPHIKTRKHGTIPGCVPAHDIWVFAEDPTRDPDRLYMTIKNPCKAYRPMY